MRDTTTERGYGNRHKRIREMLLSRIEHMCCTRCGLMLHRGDEVDLDHTDDRRGYLGLAHSACNRRAGATRGNLVRAARRLGARSRDW